MSENTGWICPSCKRGVAPGEKTCDHGGVVSAIPHVVIQGIPSTGTGDARPWWHTPQITCGMQVSTCNPFLILQNGAVFQ
jgi:uncharacterized Zn-binding protein involved in type VI secretion